MAKRHPYVSWAMKHYREQGCYVGKTEQWNQWAMKRIDLFGFLDLIAIHPIEGIIGVQVSGPSGHSSHRKKILQNDPAARWQNFAIIELITFRKLLKKKGGKQKIWVPRIERFTIQDFVESAEQMRLFNLEGAEECG